MAFPASPLHHSLECILAIFSDPSAFVLAMTMLRYVLLALCGTAALASPWARKQKRGDEPAAYGPTLNWGRGKETTTEGEQPWQYGHTETNHWGSESTVTCTPTTVYDTKATSTATVTFVSTSYVSAQGRTVTLRGSATTVYKPGSDTTITLPGSTETCTVTTTLQASTETCTVTRLGTCSTAYLPSVNRSNSTVTKTLYTTLLAPGSNLTATETLTETKPGQTVTVYEYV